MSLTQKLGKREHYAKVSLFMMDISNNRGHEKMGMEEIFSLSSAHKKYLFEPADTTLMKRTKLTFAYFT